MIALTFITVSTMIFGAVVIEGIVHNSVVEEKVYWIYAVLTIFGMITIMTGDWT